MITWLHQHWAAFIDALRRLIAAPFNTLLSLLAIGIALTLPAMGYVMLENLSILSKRGAETQQINIFLSTKASKNEIQTIREKLETLNPGHWKFIAKDSALIELKRTTGMRDIIAGLEGNPLPDAFIVEPRNQQPQVMERLAERFRKWPKVEQVQLDAVWVKRLNAFISTGRLLFGLLGIIISAGLVTVIFNTIRLQTLSHANEIEVARLIGATDAYIHRPFYYYGAVQGMLGGILAFGMVLAGLYLLSPKIAELAALYQGQFVLSGLTPKQIVLLIGSGAILGWLAARLSVSLSLHALN